MKILNNAVVLKYAKIGERRNMPELPEVETIRRGLQGYIVKQKIVDVDMEKEVKRSFIEYSMSVIAARALPDVRDGMKPGQRRIMYAMYEDHLTNDKPFRRPFEVSW